MNDDFATAMRRSLEHTRAGDPFAATRAIQAALTGSADTPSPADVMPKAKAFRRAKPPGRRSRLSQVVSELSKRAKDFEAPSSRAQPVVDVPDGALFERRAHAGPHGARNYYLYRTSDQEAPVRGVILMLHGCTQSSEDFAAGTRMNAQAERHGLVVAYPEQTRAHNAQACWNWFRPEDRSRAGGEAALLANLAAAVAEEHDVPAARVFVAGLSAGGAMAAILAQTHPEVFAAAGVHSGLAPGSASDVMSALGAMRGQPAPDAEPLAVPAIIFQGSADNTVAPVNAGRLAGPLEDAVPVSGEEAGRRYDVLRARNAAGHPVEVWRIDGAGHAWSGGDAGGSYADPQGPDASAEMVRFFLARA
ncbi:extracellular catalytic domain type 1 short-chain-length polyhydroxyalkanoate depolymerase [Citreimonas salinaria]|uniref:Esterase, PHB depolymerase family n=1 Tax=Citreimonas salinaria TaxID=321339 RepID=A0A1H3NSK1_9RHOB|nr:PHB depolymerase family esterase [Citreimonas salinaria]SDY91906.1 esterase, PHB depolymerase family [Citreimonas salinaria]